MLPLDIDDVAAAADVAATSAHIADADVDGPALFCLARLNYFCRCPNLLSKNSVMLTIHQATKC